MQYRLERGTSSGRAKVVMGYIRIRYRDELLKDAAKNEPKQCCLQANPPSFGRDMIYKTYNTEK